MVSVRYVTFGYVPYVKIVTSVLQISPDPGRVLLVSVGNDFGYAEPGVRNHTTSPYQTVVFHPSTVAYFVALKQNQNISLPLSSLSFSTVPVK